MRAKSSIFISALGLSACGASQPAIEACEEFVKERLRSPSTYERIDASYSGTTIETGGVKQRLVFLEYDAANAYGTPIRGTEQCAFEVDSTGNFVNDPGHAARMSAITLSEYPSCCLLDEEGQPHDPAYDAVIDAAEEVAADVERAAREAAE